MLLNINYDLLYQKKLRISKFTISKFFCMLLVVAGVILSTYLLYSHYNQVSPSSLFFKLCSISSSINCEKVNTSQYSSLFRLPIAAYGIIYYLFIILTITIFHINKDRLFSSFLINVLFYISSVSVLAIIPLFSISLYLRSFCPFCIATWLINILIFALIIKAIKLKTNAIFIKSLKNLYNDSILLFKDLSSRLFNMVSYFIYIILISYSVITMSSYLSIKQHYISLRSSIEAETEAKEILKKFYETPPHNLTIDNNAIYYGDKNAKVTIVEFIDLNCGICKTSLSLFKKLADTYKGKVKVIVKIFPIDPSCNPYATTGEGSGGCDLAKLSIGLRGTEKYKEFIDYITHSKEAITPDKHEKLLKSIGLDNTEMSKYINSKKVDAILFSEIIEAKKIDIMGTPTILINGRALPAGLPSYGFLDGLIKKEIKKVYK